MISVISAGFVALCWIAVLRNFENGKAVLGTKILRTGRKNKPQLENRSKIILRVM